MLQAALRWILPLAALLLIGPLAWLLVGHLRGPDGGDQASLLLSSSPLLGLFCGVCVLILAGGVGVAVARLIGAHHGLFAAGLVVAWAAWGTGSIDAIARAQTTLAGGPPSSATFFLFLAIEGLILAPIATIIAWMVIRVGIHPAPPHRPEPTKLLDPRAPLGLAAALVIGGAIAWLIALESNKGQTFAAAAFAGLFGSVAGRLVAVHVSAAAFVAGVASLAVVGPIAALVLGGPSAASGGSGPDVGGALRLASSGLLFNLARPLPLDWIAGALVGTPIGLSWAASMIEHHHHPHTHAADAPASRSAA